MASLEQIREWMRANKVTHRKMAEMIGAHPNTVTRALCGQFGASRVLDSISALVDRSVEVHPKLDPRTRALLHEAALNRGVSDSEMASIILQNVMSPFRPQADEMPLEAAEDERE